MTNYGAPPGPPPGYGPPPGGKPGFDPKTVDQLDWAIIGGAILALIFSTFSYYSASAKGELKAFCQQAHQDCSDTASAWHGFWGWFGVVLLLVAAGATLASALGRQTKGSARLTALIAAAVGLLCTIIALFVIPHGDVSGLPAGESLDKFVDFGHGFSYWIVLILSIAVTVLALMRFQQTGGQLPGRAAQAGGTPYGAAPGYGPPAAPPPPPGGPAQPWTPPQQGGTTPPPPPPPPGQPPH
jgi:hypothetical protein